MSEEVQIFTRWVDATIDDFKIALEEANKQIEEDNKEIERLHSIIKEVREYIRSNEWGIDYEHSNCRTHLLEILDKENKK